ncbi:hypothetical protein FGB62_17g356 [Gracilaria domingensis]|nr:hypothetical protein FGB62_17g356 [Gracilaria domingensis]
MENLAPQALRQTPQNREPLGKSARTEGKVALHNFNRNGTQGKRRALGDITNRAGEQNHVFASQNMKKHSITSFKLDGNTTINNKSIFSTSHTFQAPTDKFGQVLDPEIIPAPVSDIPYAPVLFDDDELESARRRLEEQAALDDDDSLDFMGRPYVRTELRFQEKVEMPYDPVEMMNDTDENDLLAVTNLDLFNADQLIPKTEFSTLELA